MAVEKSFEAASKMLGKIFAPDLQLTEKAKVEYVDFVSKMFENFVEK